MRSRRIRGLTLLELLISMGMIAIIAGVAMGGYGFAVDSQQRFEERRIRIEDGRRLEERLRAILRQAYVAAQGDDTYFVCSQEAGGTLAVAPGALTFTITGDRISSAYLRSDQDFETLNETFGPQGGPVEITLATTPTGETADAEGLFVRTQSPSDTDPTQGGTERLLDGSVETVTFEFFDGLNWLTEWDTAQTERRIPSAIRVTILYRDSDEERGFVVRLPHSDVTPDDPVTIGGEEAGL